MIVAQTANTQPIAVALGDATAIATVRRMLEARLSAEGASQDAANNTLSFFDKGVAASKEAQAADKAAHGGGPTSQGQTSPSSQGVGGGPRSTGSGTSSGHGGTGHGTSKDTSKQGASMRGSDEIRAHRALGDLYQFGKSQGSTDTGAAAQAVAWIIAVNRFDDVSDLPTQQKALAAEPLFAVIMNVPPPATAGTSSAAWNEYLSTTARSVASSGGTGRAVGGGPSATDAKGNMKVIARSAQERLQVVGQQLPPSSALRAQVDAAIADLRRIESQAAQPSTSPGSQPKGSTPKKPPPQTPQNQPNQNQPNQKQQNQKQPK
jgi:hypothetical protein